jgi:hypothetical protein
MWGARGVGLYAGPSARTITFTRFLRKISGGTFASDSSANVEANLLFGRKAIDSDLNPIVTMSNGFNQSFSNAEQANNTWFDARNLLQFTGLLEAPSPLLVGYAMADALSDPLNVEYIPAPKQLQAVQTLSLSTRGLNSALVWQPRNAQTTLPYTMTFNGTANSVMLRSPLASDIISATLSGGDLVPVQTRVRLSNSTIAANDSLQLSIDDSGKQITIDGFAVPRTYDIQFTIGSAERGFVRVPMNANERHIYRIGDLENLASSPITLEATSGQETRFIDLRTLLTNIRAASAIATNSLAVKPNPASDFATLEYKLDAPANVTVELVNVLGQTVMMLQPETMQAGMHKATLNVATLPAGTYYCRVHIAAPIGAQTQTTMLQVIR